MNNNMEYITSQLTMCPPDSPQRDCGCPAEGEGGSTAGGPLQWLYTALTGFADEEERE